MEFKAGIGTANENQIQRDREAKVLLRTSMRGLQTTVHTPEEPMEKQKKIVVRKNLEKQNPMRTTKANIPGTIKRSEKES